MDRKLIVGLGNPGFRHAHNRHNVGFQCLNRLAQAHGLKFRIKPKVKPWAQAALASGEIGGIKVALVKPLTYMNLSGQAVKALVHGYEIPLADVLVIYDDLDLPLGRIRLRPDGSSGGHKGMRSIIEHLGTQNFPRLRVGIGRPPDGDAVSHVLSDFTPEEKAVIEDTYERVIAAIECFLIEGITVAMNKYNQPREYIECQDYEPVRSAASD